MKTHEISVSEEVLKETSAHVLAHPPKFPLLNGDKDRQICGRIMDLMKMGDIVWTRHHLATGGVDYYIAEYKNLVIQITQMSYSWFELKLSIKRASDRVFENKNSGTPLCELLDFVEQQFDERTKIRRPTQKMEVTDARVIIWNILNS